MGITTHRKPIICWFGDRLYEEAHQDGRAAARSA